jgi:hypothetical protein
LLALTEYTVEAKRGDEWPVDEIITSYTNLYVASDGDAVRHPLHLEHPGSSPVFDILPAEADASKRMVFDRAADTGAWVAGRATSWAQQHG